MELQRCVFSYNLEAFKYLNHIQSASSNQPGDQATEQGRPLTLFQYYLAIVSMEVIRVRDNIEPEILLSTWMAPLRPSAEIPHVVTQKDIYGLRIAQNTIDRLIINYIHRPSS